MPDQIKTYCITINGNYARAVSDLDRKFREEFAEENIEIKSIQDRVLPCVRGEHTTLERIVVFREEKP